MNQPDNNKAKELGSQLFDVGGAMNASSTASRALWALAIRRPLKLEH